MKNNFSKKTIENILKKLDIKKNDDLMAQVRPLLRGSQRSLAGDFGW